MPSFAVQLFLFAVSTAMQINAAKKQKREADKRKGFKINVRGESAHLPVVYGKQRVGGIEVKHHISKDYYYAAAGSDSTVFDNTIGTTSVEGTKSEFLYLQSAICHDGIEGVEYILVNDRPYDSKAKEDGFKHRIHTYSEGGSADPMASANGIPSTNRFTNTAFASAVFRLNRDEPNYNGIPNLSFLVKGRKVRDISTPGGVYTMNATYSYSNNPALVLLDYLTNSNFGRGLNASEVDLESFYRAARVCETTVMNSAATFGHIHGGLPTISYPTIAELPTEGEENYYYEVGGSLYAWNTTTLVYDSTTRATSSRAVPLYECNISLNTEESVRDNIEAIMSTMALAELTWDSSGRYKLLLDYPEDQTEEDNLVDASHVFDEDSIVRDTVELNYVNAENKFNFVTVTFDNEHEDFKNDSVSWPDKTGSVYSTYLNEDNNQPFTSDISGTGITDPYHAKARAEQVVRQSREMKTIKITLSKKGITLEPGDFFKVSLESLNLTNALFRVESIKVTQELTVEVTGYSFSYGMLAWNVADDEVSTTKPGTDNSVTGPTSLTATDTGFLSPDGTYLPAVQLNWTASADTTIRNYEIQYKTSGDATYDSYRTTQLTHTVRGINIGVQYTFRVRAISNSGKFSNFITIVHTVGGDLTAPGVPTDVAAEGGFKQVTISWTNPADFDLAYIEIYENTANSTTGGTVVGKAFGDTFVRMNLGLSQTRHYYLKAYDASGNSSAFSDIASAQTTFLDDDDFENGIRALFQDAGLDVIESLATLPATGLFVGQQVLHTADNKLKFWNGTLWRSVVPGIGDGYITGTMVASNSIDTGNLKANAVTAAKIQAGTITGDKIFANTITSGLLATSGIITNTAQINDGLIINAKIDNLAVERAKIGNNAANEVYTGYAAAYSVSDASPWSDVSSDIITNGETGHLSLTLDFEGNAANTVDVIAIMPHISYGSFSSSSIYYAMLQIAPNNNTQSSYFNQEISRVGGSTGIFRTLMATHTFGYAYDGDTIRIRRGAKFKNIGLNTSGQRGFIQRTLVWVRYK
jgi:hypothetical protein